MCKFLQLLLTAATLLILCGQLVSIVDGEGQIVPGGGEGVLAPPSHGGGEVPGGLGSASGDLGEHLLSWEFV